MSRRPVIAVAGATGAVGEAMLSILHERLGYECTVHALASEMRAGHVQEAKPPSMFNRAFSAVMGKSKK